MFPLKFILFVGVTCSGVSGTRFSTSSPADGEIFNVCVGDQLVVPWTVLLTSGDVLEDIKWYFTDHTQTKEMIAISANGMFLPVPAYSSRLHVFNTSGLELSHVIAEDAGNYTMEVVSHDSSGTAVTMLRSVHVEVGDGLQTTDRELHVSYSPTAVQDSAGHWSVQLHCGTFNYLVSPPFHVQWMFPSGRTVIGTSYQGGHFTLWLSAPVEDGNYTCRIPQESWRDACLHGDQNRAQSTLYVDGTEVRLMLLEAHQAALQKQNDFLYAENSQLKDNLTQQQQEIAQLKSAEAKAERHINFHAMHLQHNPNPGETFILTNVMTNEGNAYNNTTGYFTAPYGGVYFFAANTGSFTTDQTAYVELLAEGTRVAIGVTTDPGPGETTSIQAVVHLTPGQKVWLNARGTVNYYSSITTFSGFLLYSD